MGLRAEVAEAKLNGEIAREKLQRKYAVQQAKKYLSNCKKTPGFGARYTMEDFLKLQGVRKDLIVDTCAVAKGAFDGIA